jgi:hypothetical protein
MTKGRRNTCQFSFRAISMMALAMGMGAALSPLTAHGQIYVTASDDVAGYTFAGTQIFNVNSTVAGAAGVAAAGSDIFVEGEDTGNVAEFTTSGSLVNANLIAELNVPIGIAASGTDLFVANSGFFNGSIGEYTTSGAVVNASLISGLNIAGEAQPLAISGSDLFVLSDISFNDVISEYTTSGTLITSNLVGSLGGGASGIAVSGSELYVTNYSAGSIDEFTLGDIPGTVISSNSLISGLEYPAGIAVSGSDLFVTDADYDDPSAATGEYTTSGATVNASLIPGYDPYGIAVLGSSVPEPATLSLLGITTTALFFRPRRISRAPEAGRKE